ncbi:MAG: type II toxin-antitoxin system RelE/ParE family toxin [Alphaproteobacteria bacterium]|nr:type II toxin-antitoxin system RelE/ParE family toxin [Alphaproteobacteria bacterium]
MQTIAETRYFLSKVEKILTPREHERILLSLAVDPYLGVLIEGTGGLRKMRAARDGAGKSGGFRVVYYYFDETVPLILLDLFAKNEKTNLTKAERNALALMVDDLKKAWKRRRA